MPSRPTAGLKHQIPFTVSKRAEACFDSLDRTEDLRLSPSNNWLAIANYLLDCITLFSVRIVPASTEHSSGFELVDYWQIASPSFNEVHGLDFLDDNTLVVGNRLSGIDIFKLPSKPPMGQTVHVEPSKTINKAAKDIDLQNPGSVCSFYQADGTRQILAANNYGHFISSHLLSNVGPFRKLRSRVLIAGDLGIPDGVTISDDHKYIAISNHVTHEVLVFKNTGHYGAYDEPCARLQKVIYPHGLRFTRGGKELFVSSAGSPFLHLYRANGGNSWSGLYKPANTFQVIDNDTFKAGASNDQEGGAKGLETTADGSILLVTNELAPLQTFDLPAILQA
ncbi:MAG: hypothetical protein AAFO98_09580 [Pseudomonadota bacterium]